jgi:hypothetical protein
MPAKYEANPFPKWAIAAAALLGVGLATYAARQYLPILDNSPRATVQSVHGLLYRISDTGSFPIGESTELLDGEEVRTPHGARAVLRLTGGTRVEMNERAELSVTRSFRGVTIRLERGLIIVQAAKQKHGKLYVAAGDAEVAVVGTIFSVNRGTQGSRVSVVEGNVEVAQAGRTEMLKPGGQTTTSPALAKVPVASEISWSQDAPRYLALLGELNALQDKLAAIPSNGLRYQSRLLVFTPQDTLMFAAIPNMAVTLTEAQSVFNERLRTSEVLRQWWESNANTQLRENLDFLINRLRELSSYLGEEVVITIGGSTQHPGSLVMAEVRNPAVTGLLDRYLQEAGVRKPPFVYSVRNNVLLIANSAARLQQAEAIVAAGGAPSTPFRQRIEQAYQSGAGWLLCANLEQIQPQIVRGNQGATASQFGFNTVQYFIAERRDIAGKTDNRATVTFTGPRHGIPSWLAAPGPMSTLDFVSPDAGFAVSAVVKQPRAMLEELIQMIGTRGTLLADLGQFQTATGIDVLNDLAAPLGAEGAFALDGPVLPVPSWKLALEVNAPQRLQASIEKLLNAWNAHTTGPKLTFAQQQSGGRAFYTISGGRLPTDLVYTFVDSYLLMGPNQSMLTQAIQGRQTGLTLPRSDKFRAQLPYATNPNFSAVFYHSLGTVLGPLADQIRSLGNITQAQQQSIQSLKDSQPGLIAAYADTDKITAASNGTLLGFNLSMLAGFRKGSLPGLAK